MKAPRRRVALAALGAGVVTAAALFGLCRFGAGTDTVRADAPVLVALDMDPSGEPPNSCPGNGTTGCTLGTIDTCVSASAGATLEFDVILDNLPSHPLGQGLGAINFNLRWGSAVVPPETDAIDVTARVPINEQIHLLTQASGSIAILVDPQTLPVLAPPYEGISADLGAGEPNPPFTQGTVGRYTVTISDTASPGVYKLEFVPGSVMVQNVIYYDECVDGPGCTTQNGSFAVGVPCATLSPAGGIAELPNVSGSSGPPYAVLAGLAAAALALTAGAWYVTRRFGRG